MKSYPLERIGNTIFQRARKANSLDVLHGRSPERVHELLSSACVVMHRNTRRLLEDYIVLQKRSPNKIIRETYQEMESVDDLVERLLKKRPYVFMGAEDYTVLRNLQNVTYDFTRLNDPGPEDEEMFGEYISYEEMQLSALLMVSSKTSFINDGNRYNNAEPGKRGTYIDSGVYVGMVGARFERRDVMESQYVLPHSHESMRPPLREIWEKCFGMSFPKPREVDFNLKMEDGESRFSGMDRLVYRKRMELIVKPFLKHADRMARSSGKKAYVHVTGAGLGVWSLRGCEDQMEYDLMYVYHKILSEERFEGIGVIDFAWFGSREMVDKMFSEMSLNQDVVIFCSRNSPAGNDEWGGVDKSDPKYMVVGSFAWDSNAYVGNEYYVGLLSASGDPAAASHSVIADTLNPDRNPHLLSNIVSY